LREFFRIRKVTRKWDRAAGKFFYNISFKARTEVTPRTLAVAEAFGLGVDQYQRHVIYDNVELKIGPQDIVYITGESGSGKSVLLRALEKDLGDQAINIADVEFKPAKPLIDTVGKSLEEGLELLSRVGLNDAFLFVRRYNELSEGQKYRYRLAKLMESGKQFWVMDEFCATLDRATAKIVAFNVQKLARRMGRAVLAATTHEDLFEDLKPSVYVRKGFGKNIEVKYFFNEVNEACSLTRDMRIVEGSMEDYEGLAPFHYRSSRVPLPMKIFALKRRSETVGVIVYSYAGILAFGRSKAFGRRLTVEEINRHLALISRVVLHPKYRSIGLGVRLVKETLPLAGKPFVEAVAVMAKYNCFFERAGMTKIAESKPDKSIVEAVERLRDLGFNPVALASERSNLKRLRNLSPNEIQKVHEILLGVSSGYYKRLKSSGKAYVNKSEYREFIRKASHEKLAKVLRTLAILTQTKVYLLWKNPCVSLYQ